MRIAIWGVVALCGLGMPSAGAMAKSKDKAHKAKHAADDEAEPAEPEAASAAARAKRRFGASLLVTPVSDFVLQYGLNVFYEFGRSWQFGAMYLAGSKDIKSQLPASDGIDITKATISGMAAVGYARYFVGNSFNLLAGLGSRSATAAYRVEDTKTSDYLEGHLTIQSIVLTAAIGNHWTWANGFTLGCDWLAAMVPLSGGSQSTTSGRLAGQNVTNVDDQFKSVGDKLAKTTSLTLALTSVGWLF